MGEGPKIQFSSEKPMIPEKEEPVHQKVNPGTCTSQYRDFYFRLFFFLLRLSDIKIKQTLERYHPAISLFLFASG